MLTQKQRDLLILIHSRMANGELAPSFDEMRILLGLKSKSGIHRLITGLVERGYLVRLAHRARALEVVKLPEGYAPPPSSLLKEVGEIPLANINDPMKTGTNLPPSPPETVSIPLLGRIAAGTPIEALRDEGSMLDLPPTWIGRGEFYALTVQGDSMIDAGIHSGDTVIIKRCDTAENGRIVVALVDDIEVTLKRLRRKDGMVILQAENPAYDDRTLPATRVKIQGELFSLLRTYH